MKVALRYLIIAALLAVMCGSYIYLTNELQNLICELEESDDWRTNGDQ